MNCKQCGFIVNDGDLYCHKCGAEIEGSYKKQPKDTDTSSNDFKSQFGASASKVQDDDNFEKNVEKKKNRRERQSADDIENQKFGASSSKASANKGFLNNIKNIGRLDDSKAWMKRYITSILFFIFYMFIIELPLGVVFSVLNLVMFPLIVCIYDHFARKIFKKTTFSEDIENLGLLYANIKLIIKFIFFTFVWIYSCVLGIPAFIYLYLLAKKLG